MNSKPNQSPPRNGPPALEQRFPPTLLFISLFLAWHSIVSPVLAATSANLTTIAVTNIGPATVFAGAQRVAILGFTVRVKPSGANDSFREARVQFSGDSSADIATVRLYRESGAVPGTFDS